MNNWFLTALLAANFTHCSEPPQPGAPSAPQPAPTTISMAIDTNWTEPVRKSDEEWRRILTAEQYHITREQGTERPFSSPLYENHEAGVYLCVCCQNPLFGSDAKFNSGTGWPSYFKPYFSRSVNVASDNSHGMVRDEISCARCGAHLGHVFDDGPKPTGLRYCIDGVALAFEKQPVYKKAVLAAGCFWCMEYVFEHVKGVQQVVSGYAGGKESNPTYEQVGSGSTGHAEAIEITYDPAVVSFRDLIRVFFAAQDPTQVNGQGPDHGKQYRTIAFYADESEKKIINDYIAEIAPDFDKPIAAQVAQASKFWKAEEYHQDYVKNHPNDGYVRQESLPRYNRTRTRVGDLMTP